MAGLESLLTWSIQNSSPTAPPPDPEKLKSLDPGIIDLILGKPDAVRMKESLSLALDEEKEEEERVDALDELEMLVEQIDNANNLTPLGMWTPLLELLHSTESSKIRIQLLWILGTAVQNNPKAQSDFLTYNPLPKILSLLSATETPDAATRSKAVYTLSATLKHSRAAVESLSLSNGYGWEIIRGAISDPDLSVRRKTVFMLFNLLYSSPSSSPDNDQDGGGGVNEKISFPNDPKVDPSERETASLVKSAFTASFPPSTAPSAASSSSTASASSSAAAQSEPTQSTNPTILQSLISSLQPPSPSTGTQEQDIDLREKIAKCLVSYADANGSFTDSQKADLRGVLDGEDKKKGGGGLDLDGRDWEILSGAVKA